ncbi:MAG: lectin like domain-containing protein, partial [Terracidiphilus sp.]
MKTLETCGRNSRAAFRLGAGLLLIPLYLALGLSALAQQATDSLVRAPLSAQATEHYSGQTAAPRTAPGGQPLGLIPPTINLSHLRGQRGLAELETAFPISFDLRNSGKVSPVKNQLMCGDCWAFATYGSMESTLLPSESWNFSENNLNNLSGFDIGVCKGGNGQMSTAYLARWSGPVNAADDPDPTSCSSTPTCFNPSTPNLPARKHVQDVIIVPARANSTDNNNLKSAVMNYGGVYISLSADQLGGSSPYWNASNSAYYYNGASVCTNSKQQAIECPIDHAVTLVGWNDNYSASNFTTQPPGNGAFLAKNSWGTDFGASGYFWISYYDALTAVQESFVFDDNEATTNYSTVYQYDPLGWAASLGYISAAPNTAWYSNVFKATAGGSLSAVSTYAASNGSAYEIDIYTNPTNGPTGGRLASSTVGTFPYAGYHTVTLSSPVSLNNGETFAIVAKITTPGFNYPIPVEAAVPGYSSKATASSGQSFVSSDGANWIDTTWFDQTMNVALKGFAISPASFSVSVNTNSQTVTQGQNATFRLTVQSKNGFHATVTPSATGLPTGYNAAGTGWNPPTVTPAANGSAQTVLTVATNTSTTPGTYTVTLAAAAASYATQSLNVTIVVKSGGAPPTVVTNPATSVTTTTGTINGSVNPNGSDTKAWFLFGTSPQLTGATKSSVIDIGSGTTAQALYANVASLTPSTTYYFQMVAQNSAGTAAGAIVSFKTANPQPLPTVTTGSYSNLTSSTAIIYGTVNPNGADTHIWFLIANNSSMSGASQCSPYDAGSGTSAVGVQCSISGMSAGATYYYQAVAQNSAGTVKGDIKNFTTSNPQQPPTVTTGSYSNLTTSTAIIYGTVNPNGADTHIWFLVANNNSMSGASQCTPYDAGSGTSPVQVQCSISGMNSGTTYYYQAVAQNSAGTVKGNINYFTTTNPQQPPTVTTGGSGSITSSSALIYGSVNPNGADTHVWFLIALNSSMSGAVQSSSYDVGSGTSTVSLQGSITGMSPGTTYYYQWVGQNSAGTTKGGVNYFTTSGGGAQLPTVTTGNASNVTSSSANIWGTVNPNGSDTHIWFLIALNSSMSGAYQSPSYDAGSGTSTLQLEGSITGMSPRTTYYYQFFAQNSA